MVFAKLSSISVSLADPIGSRPLVAAMFWLQHTLLGTIAQTVAIVAVAWVGLLMLTGRINVRYGVTVVMGCFVLFGASSIVAGLQSALARGEGAADGYAAALPQTPAVVIPPQPSRPRDPYAGASLPPR